jgi:hypothetical protein
MPYDERSYAALKALRARREAFEQSLSATAEEIRHQLADAQTSVQGRLERITAELGEFGAAFLDSTRFAALFDHQPEVTAAATETVEQALATIEELSRKEDELYLTHVNGQSLYEATDHALARIGRAFGAARVVSAIRADRYRLTDHARSLGTFPFARWNRAERGLAPPVVVEVDADDLRAGALVEFLDGHVTLVLVVRGGCSPAPLARMVSPSVFVAQTQDPATITRAGDFAGPAIVALVPDAAARFVHDPSSDGRAMQVEFLPSEERRPTVGGLSSTQQIEEIRLVARLAESSAVAVPEATPSSAAPAEAAEPADKLAAWLLNQADLDDLG